MISDVTTFNAEIAGASPIAGPITIGGDITTGTVFNLGGKTVTNLTIYDKADSNLNLPSVTITTMIVH